MTLFQATNLHKRFGARVVLENISLGFAEGTVTGIMGPNGAGKTTCFNVLTGRYRPDRGEIRLDGRRIDGMAPHQVAGLGVARSFQLMTLFDDFTARDNILLALPGFRARRRRLLANVATAPELNDEASQILRRVGLLDRDAEVARRLSYGERRALEIGVALAANPRILFLDEPTAGLGTEATRDLARLIETLRRDYTIVIIEHDMRFLFGLADRVAVIHWGQVIAEGTPGDLRANDWVRRSSLGRLD
jgi:branched-chain amino acid transport system ATP-binding protein